MKIHNLTLSFIILLCGILLPRDFDQRDIPIHENGRIKPLDTFVRNQLLTIYGKRSIKSITLPKEIASEELSAIDWFFDNEEMGVILEDDCLPSQSFFWFCEELLERYKDDMRVWHISGDNFQDGIHRGDGDYYFSKYNHIWGWASWTNRWGSYDVKMESYNLFETSNQLLNVFNNTKSQKYWADVFFKVSDGQIDTWDYQWTYTVLSNSGLSVLPNKNLISNIGFGPDATHTMDLESQHSKLERKDMSFPIKHPQFVIQNCIADDFTESKMFVKRNILFRVLSRIKRVFR